MTVISVSEAIEAFDAVVRYHFAVVAAQPCQESHCKSPAGRKCHASTGKGLTRPHKSRCDDYDFALAEGGTS